MITRIEALRYRSLQYVSCPLGPVQVLVGPNGSGKTTFLDALAFLSDLLDRDFEAAISLRTSNPLDLVWARTPGHFELAIEAAIPPELQGHGFGWRHVRYEIRVRISEGSAGPEIAEERALLLGNSPKPQTAEEQPQLFPRTIQCPDSIMLPGRKTWMRTIFRKNPDGYDKYYSEKDAKAGKSWFPSIRLGPRRSAFFSLPDDPERFPATGWLRQHLRSGVQRIILNSLAIRNPSPPGKGTQFRPDGSNLPWVVQGLREKRPERFQQWVAHVRSAIADLEDVRVVVRPEDHHAYLVVRYRGGLDVPSWMVSDGTLRLFALTILAYIPAVSEVFLVEEPENGIHPTAIETVFQSLNSVYDGQVLLATHSPVILAAARPQQLLCFARDANGATDVILGDKHPALREWKEEVSLADLFASGVLG